MRGYLYFNKSESGRGFWVLDAASGFLGFGYGCGFFGFSLRLLVFWALDTGANFLGFGYGFGFFVNKISWFWGSRFGFFWDWVVESMRSEYVFRVCNRENH